ncbi:hypothetical protein ACWGLO_26010 [Streptomyces niveus]
MVHPARAGVRVRRTQLRVRAERDEVAGDRLGQPDLHLLVAGGEAGEAHRVRFARDQVDVVAHRDDVQQVTTGQALAAHQAAVDDQVDGSRQRAAAGHHHARGVQGQFEGGGLRTEDQPYARGRLHDHVHEGVRCTRARPGGQPSRPEPALVLLKMQRAVDAYPVAGEGGSVRQAGGHRASASRLVTVPGPVITRHMMRPERSRPPGRTRYGMDHPSPRRHAVVPVR